MLALTHGESVLTLTRSMYLRKVDGSPEDAIFKMQQREQQLEKLKATLAKKNKPSPAWTRRTERCVCRTSSRKSECA